jgi:preprotein translocase subunit SecG
VAEQQMLFGGSGGQDLFQKATWVLVGIFLAGSLGLAIYKNKTINQLRSAKQTQSPFFKKAPFVNHFKKGSHGFTSCRIYWKKSFSTL